MGDEVMTISSCSMPEPTQTKGAPWVDGAITWVSPLASLHDCIPNGVDPNIRALGSRSDDRIQARWSDFSDILLHLGDGTREFSVWNRVRLRNYSLKSELEARRSLHAFVEGL